ncbi:hypothetical protein G6011_04356 [Alternaria panax]|uniref:Zn(2)-C6 fungal-type domain-containing protein n=1 Tax=Alternaria panax TaxID=48097 RepID=A0AAD4IGC6_9PLEO|nr:hypothetical protein G6011_04356 [Alternaria panax]
MAEAPFERIDIAQDQFPIAVDTNRRKQQPQQPRQLLSCTKCRERKVKCDRTKPCSACCARGSPRDCHFIAEDGNYAPIQQSYELRKLRAENLRLKERLRACQIPLDDNDAGLEVSPDFLSREGAATSHRRRRAAKQKRFQISQWQDSIYFGSPGLATVISDFTSADASCLPLSYTMPRSSDMFRSSQMYPFPTLFSATPDECFPQLLSCLPAKDELMEYLGASQKRLYQVPAEITKSEIEDFLSDARRNSELYPTTLALLFGFIALGTQHSAWDRGGARWDAKVIEVEMQKGNVYIAAAMQALRLASFTHKPSLSAIQTLLMIGSYLTNTGRMLDAYTLFGTTIRLAHSIGLHRHPKYLNPTPTNEKDCAVRQRVWWHMLHLDEHMSMTLGRPLGISGIGDNPWPIELTTDPVLLRLGEFVNHFTVLARQIMTCDRLTGARIDELTDTMRKLLDTVPETLQFQATWMHPETNLPELNVIATVYFCRAHTYIILLNRQRTEKHTLPAATSIGGEAGASLQAVNRSSSFGFPSETYSAQPVPRGRTLVLASSEALLSAFMFFYHRDPAALIDWNLAQQAFNSCMLLLLNAIEHRTITVGAMKAEQAFVVFKDLYENKVHRLAGLAVEKISSGLQELRSAITQPPGVLPRGQGNVATQCTGHNEATRAMADTVTSHTGMFLLEDSGTQTVTNEAFVPKPWADSRASTRSKEEKQGSSYLSTMYQKETQSSKEPGETSRSVDIM